MLGENIRQLRYIKNWSLDELSEKTGVSKGGLSDIENGKAKNPRIDTISNIAKTLEVSIESMLRDDITAKYDNLGIDLKERIKLLCKTNKTNLAKLERMAGLGKGSISKWDKHSPAVNSIILIAIYFNVSTDFLLGVKQQERSLSKHSTLELIDELHEREVSQ